MKKSGALLLAAACVLTSIGNSKVICQAKTNGWTQLKRNENVWEQEQASSSKYAYRSLYLNYDKLYQRVRYKADQKSEGKKITSWKIDRNTESMTMVAVKGKNAYVQWHNDEGATRLYSVNIKTGKKKIVSKKFNRCAGTADYVYANNEKPSDTGALEVSVWKVTNSSIRKGKSLGKYIFGTTIYDNYVYYGKYSSASQKTVAIYRCAINGSHVKKLFTVKGSGQYAQSLLSKVENGEITVSTQQNGKGVIYTYNIKTKKKSKKAY